MRDAKERLRHILDAIAAIERYLSRGRAAFEQDEHIDLDIVWEAASRDAPALSIERLLKRLEELGYGG